MQQQQQQCPTDSVVDLSSIDTSSIVDDDDGSERFMPLNVWGFDKISKTLGGPNGTTQQWQCGWCGYTFKGWNATKALHHITKTRGKDIRICSSNIPKESLAMYKSMRDQKSSMAAARAIGTDLINARVDTTQQSVAVLLEGNRKRKSTSMGEVPLIPSIPTADGSVSTWSSQPMQGTVTATMSASLTVAIADFVHSKGLPFSVIEGAAFDRILKYAKHVPSNYRKPTRHAVSNQLLKTSYDTRMKNILDQLDKEANVFGLTISGDGATVKKVPLINLLATGVHQPSAVLDIHDCTKHMAAGGKKDAEYIYDIAKPFLMKIDRHKTKVDCVFFDGASNVQKGGAIMEAHNPRLTVLHGAEHVMGLVFSDLAKLWPINILINHYRRVYRLFGSGSMHAPFAMFSTQARMFNKGRKVGLIRAADTRMAGYFYALHRMLRLKNALLATITSAPFKALKLKKWTEKVVEFLSDTSMWTAVYAILRSCFPLLRVLRLADKTCPGTMDKLHYYVGRTSQCVEKSQGTLNHLEYFRDKSFTDSSDTTGLDDGYQSDDDDDVTDADNNDEEIEECSPSSVDTDSSESEDEDDDDDDTRFLLGHDLTKIWNRRRVKLESDFAIAAWFLSPCQEIRADVNSRHTAKDRDAVDRVVGKLFHPMEGEALGKKLTEFWTEWRHFSNKTGPFAKDYIWWAPEIANGQSHLWHQQYSLVFAETLGKVACRVCAKNLGIGSCERCWGVVKQLKDGQRTSILSTKVKMQATIYGGCAIDKARTMREAREAATVTTGESMIWTDTDDAFNLGMEQWGLEMPELPTRPKRVFKAWIEEWEPEAMKTNDPVCKAKLLHKYGGLNWIDPDDNDVTFVSSVDQMEWEPGRSGCGWMILGHKADDMDADPEPWHIDLVIDEIAEFEHPSILNIEVIKDETIRSEQRRVEEEKRISAERNEKRRKAARRRREKSIASM